MGRGLGLFRTCGWVGWSAAMRVPMVWLALLGWTRPAAAQTGADGAIGGVVLTATGALVDGAVVVVRGTETGLVERARSGTRGEFLVVRLPVGEYSLSVENVGGALTLPGPVVVSLGEVTEVEARMPVGRNPPAAAGSAGADDSVGQSPAGVALGEVALAQLPVQDGEWRSLALVTPQANAAAEADDTAGEVTFRGVAMSQNSTQTDGLSADDAFGGARAGAGVQEEVDAGSDEVLDRSSGAGSGAGSVVDGGQRAGSAYTFAQGAVREFRVQGQGDAATYGSALYGHGVGGVVTTVSRSGGTRLHGMAFYTVRDSAWAAANPFSVASSYVNGVVSSGVVKPNDQRQQFGGSLGGPIPGFKGDRR